MLSNTTAIAKAWARLDPKSDLMNQNLLKPKTPLDSDNGYSRSLTVLIAHLHSPGDFQGLIKIMRKGSWDTTPPLPSLLPLFEKGRNGVGWETHPPPFT